MPSASSVAAVTQDYTIELLRSGSTSEINSWASAIDAGFLTIAQVASAIANSAESTMFVVPVEQLYAGILGRVADVGGLTSNANALRSGTSINTLVGNLVSSQEFANDYAGGGALSTINPAAFVTVMYNDFLGRAPDQAGLAGWVAVLSTVNAANLAKVIEGFLFSNEYSQDSGNPIVQYLANSGIAGTYASTILGLPGPAGGGTVGQSTFTLTTGVDHVNNVTTVFGDITPFISNGIGPTLNQGDTVSNVTNVVITDEFANQGFDVIPDGAVFTNVKNITLNTDANAGTGVAGGGVPFDTSKIAGVVTLTVTSIGNGVDEDNAGPTTTISETQNSTGAAGGANVTGGSNVTVTSKGGAGVVVGNNAILNAALVPLQVQLPTGTVVVNEQNPSAGGVNVMGGTAAAGGTAVTVNVASASNTGTVQIGNTPANTGNNPVAGYTNPVGAVSVTDAGVGFVTDFGGTNVVVNSAAGGVFPVPAAGEGVTVGDPTAAVLSNEPTGTITITDKAVAPFDGLNNTAFFVAGTHNFVAAPDAAFGGTNVTITTNAGLVAVGTAVAVPGTLPTGNVTVIDTANNVQALTEGAGNTIIAKDPIGATVIGTQAVIGAIAATAADVAIYGGINISVQAANANVFVGTNNAGGVTLAAALPTGTVSVTETVATTLENVQGIAAVADNLADIAFGAGGQAIAQTEYAVNIDGGNGVTVSALGQNVFVGVNLGTAGAQTITQSAVLTGDGLSNPTKVLGAGNGAIVDDGGTTVAINTTGGAVTVGSTIFDASGTITINDTFGAGNATNDPIQVLGAFTANSATAPNAGVTITTTPDKAFIDVGATNAALVALGGGMLSQANLQALALNAGRTGLAAPNFFPVTNVTINDSQTNGATVSWGKGNVNVFTNGATAVSISGGSVLNVVDVEAIKSTSGKSIGTSALATVTLDGAQTAGNIGVQSDALATLTILDNTVANAYFVTDATLAALALGLGNDTTSFAKLGAIGITDATATSVTITDNGKADTAQINLAIVAATTLTVNNSAAATLNLAGDTALTGITLTGAGATTLLGVQGLTGVTSINGSKSSGSITASINPVFTSFVGGLGGSDTVTISANSFSFGASVKLQGGVGTTNILVANYASAPTDQALGNLGGSVVTGFQILGLGPLDISTGSTAYDANGFTGGVQIGGFGIAGAALTGNVTVINAATNTTLAILQDTGPIGTPFTVSFAGLNTGATNDGLTLALGSGAGATALNIHSAATGVATATGAITANAFESLIIASNGSTNPNVANTITLNDAATAGSGTLTVNGGAALTLTDNAIGGASTNFTSITSTDTGKVNVNAVATSNVGVVFTGGAGSLFATGSTAATTEVILETFGTKNTPVTTTPFAVADAVTLNIVVNPATTTGETYVATVSGKAASDADLSAALASAILFTTTAGASGSLTFTDAADGATVTTVVTADGGGAASPAGLAAISSGASLVLSATPAILFNPAITTTSANGTVAQTINSGPEETLIQISGAVAAGNTYIVTVTPVAGAAIGPITYTAVAGDTTLTVASNLAGKLQAAIIPATPIVSGFSAGSDATGGDILVTGNSNFYTVTTAGTGTLAAGAEALAFGAVTESFTAGAGGGNYTLGLGGSWDVTAHAYASGSEAVNFTASKVAATVSIPDGAIAINNGVTGFAVGSLAASDIVHFVTAPKTILANTTGTPATVGGVAGVLANVFDGTGALSTALQHLTFAITNGVITFGGNVGSLTATQLIDAAEILVSSAGSGGGANMVAAFSNGANSYVVASDAANTLLTSGLNSNTAVVELAGVSSVTGFGVTFGQGTIVDALTANVADVTNLSNTNILASAPPATPQNDAGFALQTISGVGVGGIVTVNNLAPSAVIVDSSTGNYSLTTTQSGAAGMNSLSEKATASHTINTLTVTGDGLVAFAPQAGATLTVGTLVDGGATPTLTNINFAGAGGGITTVGAINDSALTTINTTSATGLVTIGNGTALSQPLLTVTDGSATVAGSQLNFTATSGSTDTITIGTATANNNNANTLVVPGQNSVITIDGTGNNVVTANGTSTAVTIGDATNGVGVNAVVVSGASETVTFLGAQAAGISTVLVGSNATVTFGTTTGAGGHNEQVIVTNALTGATTAMTTLNGAADNANGNQQIFFGTVGSTHEGLAGASVEASLVNTSSVTTLTAALNLAASLATTAVQPNPNLPGFAQLQPGDGVIDWFQFQGNTYIVEVVNPTAVAASHATLAASDVVVKLAGLVDIGANGTFAAHNLTL